MSLAMFYEALEVTLTNDQKIQDLLLSAHDIDIKVLIIFICFQFTLFAPSALQMTIALLPRALEMNLKDDPKLKFISSVLMLQILRVWLLYI